MNFQQTTPPRAGYQVSYPVVMDKHRILSQKIEQLLELFPVVAIVGSRQCGKSTLVKALRPVKKQVLSTLLRLSDEKFRPYRYHIAQYNPFEVV